MGLSEEAAALGLSPKQVEQLAAFCGDNAERQEAARNIIGFLGEAPGNWSNDRPEQPGLYWMKGPDREPRNIVRIEDSTGELRARMIGNPVAAPLDERWDHYEWSGPLHPPG
jgi:hypothetical protein